MTITSSRSTRWRLAALTATCLLALPVSACGAFGGTGGGGPSEAEQAEKEDAWLKVVRCMREHGVPAEAGEGGGITIDRDANVDSTTLKKADEACKEELEAALPKEAREPIPAEQKQKMLAEAQCMRERGWDQPDPEFPSGGGVRREPPSNVDLNDPQLEKDHEECAAEAGTGEDQP
ncbi:MAG: hypothetical protein GEU96_17135 [Propionibacteriales bacterium]|nr:hypothetical protein [Propionibacteriales bacterium]